MRTYLPEKVENLLTDASNLTYLVHLASFALNLDHKAAIGSATIDASRKIDEAMKILRGEDEQS